MKGSFYYLYGVLKEIPLFIFGLIGLFLILGLCGLSIATSLEDYFPNKPNITEETEIKSKVVFSTWDGSNRKFVNEIKSNMKNPSSFKHIKTWIQGGNVYMEYSGINSFGARIKEIASIPYNSLID